MSNDILVTQEGLQKLKTELEELRGPRRMLIADAIREAKSHGDLRENSAYHEAKLNQTRLDARIAELERAIQTAKVVERSLDGGAQLGSKVTLLDLEYDEELRVEIVGAFEADPAKDLISIVSPLGESLLGKQPGAEISISAPAGTQNYRIIAVD